MKMCCFSGFPAIDAAPVSLFCHCPPLYAIISSVGVVSLQAAAQMIGLEVRLWTNNRAPSRLIIHKTKSDKRVRLSAICLAAKCLPCEKRKGQLPRFTL
jgi:hypothetical protein